MKEVFSIIYLVVCVIWLVVSIKIYKDTHNYVDNRLEIQTRKTLKKFEKRPSRIKATFNRILFKYRVWRECKKDYYKLV